MQPATTDQEDDRGVAPDVVAAFLRAVVEVDLPAATATVTAVPDDAADADAGASPADGDERAPDRPGTRWPTGWSSVTVLTAHNPGGRRREVLANHDAQAALLRRLQDDGHQLLPARGRSPDRSWVEPSVAVRDLAPGDGLRLAREHHQAALFRWTPDQLDVLWTVEPHVRDRRVATATSTLRTDATLRPRPAWADEPIVLVEHDERWAATGQRLAAGLDEVLRGRVEGRVEHVGSTAVPGLAAKPVVDLLVPIAAGRSPRVTDDLLAALGWELVPPQPGEPRWHRTHVLADGATRVAHLHVVEADRPQLRDMVRLRDALRSDAALAARYLRAKREAALAHPRDREAYTAAKAPAVQAILAELG